MSRCPVFRTNDSAMQLLLSHRRTVQEDRPGTFPFLNLPSELRIQVYEHLFRRDYKITPVPCTPRSSPDRSKNPREWRFHDARCGWDVVNHHSSIWRNMAISRTSKLLRRESRPIFYEVNGFEFVKEVEDMRDFFEALASHGLLKHIRRFAVFVSPRCISVLPPSPYLLLVVETYGRKLGNTKWLLELNTAFESLVCAGPGKRKDVILSTDLGLSIPDVRHLEWLSVTASLYHGIDVRFKQARETPATGVWRRLVRFEWRLCDQNQEGVVDLGEVDKLLGIEPKDHCHQLGRQESMG